MHIYIYIYIYLCRCVCIYIYIYTYDCACVCVLTLLKQFHLIPGFITINPDETGIIYGLIPEYPNIAA